MRGLSTIATIAAALQAAFIGANVADPFKPAIKIGPGKKTCLKEKRGGYTGAELRALRSERGVGPVRNLKFKPA